MKLLNVLLLSLGLAVSIPALAGRAGVPVYNLEHQTAVRVDGKPLTLEQMRAAIIAGAGAKGWTLQQVDDHTYQAKLDVRGKHFAVVKIAYSEKEYNITYESSVNLNAEEKKAGQKYSGDAERAPDGTVLIHPNYNNWVRGLAASINAMAAAAPLPAAQ